MIEIAFSALLTVLSGWHLLYMLLGVLVGLVVGILPGLGGIAGMAILLPFIYGMEPVSALGMLIGLVAVIPTGDTFTSVMMGIPGSSASQATVLDGFPLAKKGEAARALSAAFFSSMLGGVFGALVLTMAIVVARPLILLFSSAELFMLAVFGLSMVAVLAGRRPIKGLIAAAFGLLIATVGQQGQSGIMRFVFDQPYLLDGIPLSIIALALFGIPSALDLALTKIGVEQQPAPLKGSLLDGVKDTLREWWLVLRCSFIGVWVGIVPGIGSQVVDWLAYGHAAQTSKDAKNFGKGDVRGVIAPESANDAKDGGDLVTTLLLGFPQGVVTALFIVALLAWGYLPGPEMVKKNLDIVYSVVWIQGISGVIGTLVGFVLAAQLAKLAQVRYSVMVPIIFIFVLMGAFSVNRDPIDLLVVVVFGIIGYLMRRFGYPRPAMILGLVLGGLMETYLYRSMASYGFSWLARPSVIVLLSLATISFLLTMRARLKSSPKAQPA
jgi:TctA family transporter